MGKTEAPMALTLEEFVRTYNPQYNPGGYISDTDSAKSADEYGHKIEITTEKNKGPYKTRYDYLAEEAS